MDKIDHKKQKEELIKMLTDVLYRKNKDIDSFIDYDEDFDEDDYIDFKKLEIDSIEKCLVEGYNNVVDMEKYRTYIENKFDYQMYG